MLYSALSDLLGLKPETPTTGKVPTQVRELLDHKSLRAFERWSESVLFLFTNHFNKDIFLTLILAIALECPSTLWSLQNKSHCEASLWVLTLVRPSRYEDCRTSPTVKVVFESATPTIYIVLAETSTMYEASATYSRELFDLIPSSLRLEISCPHLIQQSVFHSS